MFTKNSKVSADVLGKTNRIVEGTIITGTISSEADFRLDGHLIGNFTSQGKIVIGQKGSVKGDIVCQNADIEGHFIGKIKVADVLNIKEKANIQGEVFASKLSVEPGANFTAVCKMLEETDKKNITTSGVLPKKEIK